MNLMAYSGTDTQRLSPSPLSLFSGLSSALKVSGYNIGYNGNLLAASWESYLSVNQIIKGS